MNDIGKDTLAAMALAYKYRAEEAEDSIEALEAELKKARKEIRVVTDRQLMVERDLRVKTQGFRTSTGPARLVWHCRFCAKNSDEFRHTCNNLKNIKTDELDAALKEQGDA